jgi:RNA-splicing ligase RtcB
MLVVAAAALALRILTMGSPSFHVEGRGSEEALCSSAHGAGRALSRGAVSEQKRAAHSKVVRMVLSA